MSTASSQTALSGLQDHIRAIPLENIANIAKDAFTNKEILPLWFGEGDIKTPDFIGQAITSAMQEGKGFYSHQNGIPELRQALVDYLGKLNAKPITTDRITVTSGGMPAIMLAVQATVGRGDNVVIIDPVWPNITGVVRLMGAETRSVRMDLGDDGWTLDVEKVAAACDSRTKAIFFASPGNPTGAVLPVPVQKQLLELSRKTGIWIFSDEVYSRMSYEMPMVPSFSDIAEPEDRVIIINSFSKSWSMTGSRLGWLIHPPSLEATLAMMVQYTSSGTTTYLQYGGVAALQQGEDFVKFMTNYCREGMEIVCGALEDIPRVILRRRPTAAMYAFFEIDGMADSKQACLDILRSSNVGLAPGYFFGKGSESFLRICYCRSPEQLNIAMERLKKALK
ncbi:pyridoxal phosphate-dependent aminotransferase [Paremcibacter congregatus]|uniref:pyridoxal phosphate-dependent aminotransferase n=1 Tax=Paremcibacter congregatus TaxID=2043170 RepID=UPI003A95B379